MSAFVIYLIGWLILSFGYYLYNINKDKYTSKKLHAWRAFWVGIWSWLGILMVITHFTALNMFKFNDWVENKLS